MKDLLKSKTVRAALLAVGTLVISASIYMVDQNSSLLKTSVLDFPEHAAFDGTAYPIQKVPNWVKVSASNWDLVYNEMSSGQLIDIPYYSPSQLETPVDELIWGNADDDMVRNAKITYSVPYLGNYLLDGHENAGSHPAVDIKIPIGTPVHSIANGTVIKVSSQSSGFGHHIVVQHDNFPSLNNSNAKETIYSSYSHLSDLFISEGDVVVKGEQIALSGATGTATTPHLHFQIDNDDAPWHPYWPFTWQDVQDAGLDFFSAINEGLGASDARATTVNPMKYVQAYLDDSAEYVSLEGTVASSYVAEDAELIKVVEIVEEIVDEPEVIDEPKVVDEPEVREPSVLEIVFDIEPKYIVDGTYDFTVSFRDQYGEPFIDGFNEDIVLTSARGNIKINGPILSRSFLSRDAVYEKSFHANEDGKDRIELKIGDELYYSNWFDIIDLSGDELFTDLSSANEYFIAIMDLAEKGVVAGYPDGTFRPENTVTRVEALKFILEGIKAKVTDGELPFSDVSDEEWYAKYLYTAVNTGVVDGYEDGTFRPENTVNKAEFYKILFNGMGMDINPNVSSLPFTDVSADDWFAPYVVYAYKIGIIDADVKNLNASNGMTRAEVAYAIYKVMRLAD